jgi:hypothetical protein
MTTALALLVLAAPFALAALLTWAADRTGTLRLHLDQFRVAAPMVGRLFDDREVVRAQHDIDAIRSRFERQPVWPSSTATGERR